MKILNYTEVMALAAEKLMRGGLFLTAGGERPNTMTIGWGSIGNFWGKPMFVVAVRPQRHTYSLLKATGEFTVSVPTTSPMRAELAYAGTASGATEDKFSGHGLTAVPAQSVSAPVIGECGIHFECRVRLMQDMTPEEMDPEIARGIYPQNDFHTLFFGEIVDCYSTDE